MLDKSAVRQLSSLSSRTKWRVKRLAGDTLPTIAAILFYWIRMKVVQLLTCLTLGRPNGLAYSISELLNTQQDGHWVRQGETQCLAAACGT